MNYTDFQLFNSQQIENELSSGQPLVKVFREALRQGDEMLKLRFQTSRNATESVTQRAWLADQILQHLAKQLCVGPDADKVAFVAVGGYGRGELHPGSDIDLLILLESPATPAIQECLERFITLLWDIRLQVGQSVRTLAECEQEAANDITIATNLMEARLLKGPPSLFKEMQAAVGPERVWPTDKFFAAKTEEEQQRYHKYNDTAYNLEPNLKEGPGGLRDIHLIGWVAKRYFGATTLHDLVGHAFLTESEYQTLMEAQEFLWQVRCMLHTIAGRREDRLLFDYQRTLAKSFGHEDDAKRLGVEKFMRQYYRTAMIVGSHHQMLLQLFQEAILYAHTTTTIVPLNKRFQLRNDFIEATHDKVFLHYPFALLEIFLLMQQHPDIKGIRASTIRLLHRDKYLIDSAFLKDLRARSLFIEIFRQPQGLTQALRRMNNYGILGAYLPAFGRIVGQMQYDLFHVYTVDQHSIVVVRNLRRFTLPEHHHEFPLCSKIMERLPKSELLYLAALFHDIAKGRRGDHSELGEVEAMDFSQAHGLSDNDCRLVAWLVRHHLIMSMTAQRQDTSDPKVIKAFAQRVGDTTRLDYLYLLTVADIRATNPKMWNGWKAVLLADLYHKTYEMLQQGFENAGLLDKHNQIKETQTQALRLLNPDEEEIVIALWEDLGEDYFLCSSTEHIAHETQAILNHKTIDQPLVLERHNTQGITEVMIYLRDRDYLFADITYCLEQQNVTIVNAYIVPTQREYTISGYTFLESDGTAIAKHERIEGILEALRQALVPKTSAPSYRIHRHIPRQLKYFPVPTRLNFKHDGVNNRTELEVITTDRPGLLSSIAQAFAICQVRVKKAKIATLGSRVEDIFFITDFHDQALHSADQIDCLCEQLSKLLDGNNAEASAISVNCKNL
jgi:[protein-PII] uridylyltransferase